MFDPRDFFLPKKILPPLKQAHFLSLSFTDLSAQPRAFEIGENYHGAPDTSHTCHKEQIKDILNYLDELSLDRIEEMEGHVDGRVIIQQNFDKPKSELQEARAQIAGIQRKQMKHNDKITLARFRISTLELIIEDIQVRHQSDIKSLLDTIHELKNCKMPPKRTTTSAAPPMTQAAIKKLVSDSVATALEAQAATMANTDNTNRNIE
nr:hypothetical protein [Tanacetum cinerariifolium]